MSRNVFEALGFSSAYGENFSHVPEESRLRTFLEPLCNQGTQLTVVYIHPQLGRTAAPKVLRVHCCEKCGLQFRLDHSTVFISSGPLYAW